METERNEDEGKSPASLSLVPSLQIMFDLR